MSQAHATTSASRNGHEPGATVPADDPRRTSLLGRVWRELAGLVQRRIPRADLDERDPDYIRETAAAAVAAREPVVPGRGPRAWATSPTRDRCCSSATTRAAT